MDALLIYLFIINGVAFSITGLDKSAAVHKRYRVPEKTLFILAIVGGSPGLYLAMFFFRHKTKHASFRIGIPLIIVIQLALAWFRFNYL